MKSAFKCVFWHVKNKNWVAKVKVNYKSIHLGSFASDSAANEAVAAFKLLRGLMPPAAATLTLADAFDYRDGHLYAKYPASYVKAGDRVGSLCQTHGYTKVGHAGKLHQAHRVVWRMFHGAIPAGMQIDHINGCRSDNQIENLRLVTKDENARNRRTPVNNTSGEIGIQQRSSGHFQVRVGARYVGNFSTMTEAIQARICTSRAAGFHANHGRIAV